MSKYCVYCGKLLQEGESCGCQQQAMQQNYSVQPDYMQQQQQVNSFGNNQSVNVQNMPTSNSNVYVQNTVMVILNFFKQLIMHPFDAMDILLESNSYLPSIIILALHTLLSSLFAVVSINNAGWILKLMNIGGSAFLYTLLGTIILSAVFLGGVVLCTLISKQKVELVIAMDAVAIRSGILVIFNLLAILFNFLGSFGYKLSFIFFVISELFALVLVAIVLSEKLQFNKTGLFYVIPIVLLIMFGINTTMLKSYVSNLQTKLVTEDYAEKVQKYIRKNPEEAEKTFKSILGAMGKDADSIDDIFDDLF